jgi:predicted RNase H-like HicB family nuclease
MTMISEFAVAAVWDPEASVWVATSDDVPGLVTEAETLEALEAKLQTMVPELLRENEVAIPGGAREIVVALHILRKQVLSVAA